MVKISKNVLDTHLMNLEAFILEYSPKSQILFTEFEIWYAWLKLDIMYFDSKFQTFQRIKHHYFFEIVSFIALELTVMRR